MKKLIKLLSLLIVLAAFVSCDLGTDDSSGDTSSDTTTDQTDNKDNTDTTSLTSEWWIKGSFDAWADSIDDGTRHYFTMDVLDNNQLSFEIEDLYALDYEFVLVNPDGTEFRTPNSDKLVADTAVTFVDKATDGSSNAAFTAEKLTYVVKVDISNPAAPAVTIESGASDAKAVTFGVLAENLKIKGDAFTIGWTETAGTADTTAETVTFEVTAASKSGSFGFQSLDGFLKGATVASPTVAAASADQVSLSTDGDNCTITGIPKSNSVYTIAIAINENATTIADKYKMTVTLKDAGTTDWAFDPWTEVYVPGGMNNWGKDSTNVDWSDAASAKATLNSDGNVATFTFTANQAFIDYNAFKITSAADWSSTNAGFSGITEGTGSLTLSDKDGNISFAATLDASYTIKIDFTTTSYTVDGKPTVTVTAN